MLCGVFFRQKQNTLTTSKQSLLNSIDIHNCSDYKGTWQNDYIMLANALCTNSPNSVSSLIPFIHKETGIVLIAWVRLDYRKDLISQLGTKSHQSTLSDSELIIAAYLKWGEECCTKLFGDYCFAIYDPRNQSVFCARDHMGIRPLYYYVDDNIFAFSSSMALFHKLPIINLNPNQQWIALHLIMSSMDTEKTAYDKIKKLKASHWIKADRSTIKNHQYFEFDPYKTNTLSEDDQIECYRDLLITAVKSRIQTTYPLACELSWRLTSYKLLYRLHSGGGINIANTGCLCFC